MFICFWSSFRYLSRRWMLWYWIALNRFVPIIKVIQISRKNWLVTCHTLWVHYCWSHSFFAFAHDVVLLKMGGIIARQWMISAHVANFSLFDSALKDLFQIFFPHNHNKMAAGLLHFSNHEIVLFNFWKVGSTLGNLLFLVKFLNIWQHFNFIFVTMLYQSQISRQSF